MKPDLWYLARTLPDAVRDDLEKLCVFTEAVPCAGNAKEECSHAAVLRWASRRAPRLAEIIRAYRGVITQIVM